MGRGWGCGKGGLAGAYLAGAKGVVRGFGVAGLLRSRQCVVAILKALREYDGRSEAGGAGPRADYLPQVERLTSADSRATC